MQPIQHNKEWETGGSQRLIIDSALNVISTALAGRPAAEVVASGLSPAVNNQIKKATTDAKGNVNKNKFTPSQLNAIYKGESKIPSFTQPHQDTGRMQLVDYDLHKETGHIGWESMKNGK